MQFIYLDAGLYNNNGHHANSCRHIVGEMRSRGIGSAVLSFDRIVPELRDELGALPWFRFSPYISYSQDPISGWLDDYYIGAQGMLEDLLRLMNPGPDDLFFFNSILPPQLRAIIQWAKRIPVPQRPTVIAEFGTDPGLDVVGYQGERPEFAPRDTRVDSRAVLYRHTGKLLTEEDRSTIRLATFDAQSSQAYEMLMNGYPVGTLPLPQHAVTDCHSRVGKRPITVSFLGHQRGDKGFAMVPELVLRLLKSRTDIRLLVHNGWPTGMVDHQQWLRNCAAIDSRLELNEQEADGRLWSELLNASDLIVCPYIPDRFVAAYSAVASEAIANAIPLVVPERTTLASVLHEFGDPGTCFGEYSVDSVLAAIVAALDDFDQFAQRADSASRRWTQSRGIVRLADTILTWKRSS